jgi:hypothetical protein
MNFVLNFLLITKFFEIIKNHITKLEKNKNIWKRVNI